MSRCCHAGRAKGDIGFRDPGLVVSVHRRPTAQRAGLTSQSSGLIEVEWDGGASRWGSSSPDRGTDRSAKLLAATVAPSCWPSPRRTIISVPPTRPPTGWGRDARFEFELRIPAHATPILAAAGRVDLHLRGVARFAGKNTAH